MKQLVRRWLGPGVLLGGSLFLGNLPDLSAWTDDPVASRASVTWRRHQEGPLTADDFRAAVPAFRNAAGQLSAFTVTEIRYDTRYRVVGNQNRWTARMVSAEAFAVVLRDRSWNRTPLDKRLLDHEQGHFDLCHTFALSAQLRLDELIRSRRAPVGTGGSSAAATSDLDEKLRRELKAIFDGNVQAQADYDRLTEHGTANDPQAEHRRGHLARIAELNELLQRQLHKKSGQP